MKPQSALITGAGQGMGESIARAFAAQSMDLMLVGRTASKLDRVAEACRALSANVRTQALDITDADAPQRLSEALAGQPLDVLINCAGDWLIEPFATTTPEQLDHILAVNLRAPYLLTRALLPNLRQSQNASIINIGSMAAVGSFPGITAYTAAKTGLRGLTGSMAAELRPELIRVVMVSPTPANTPMRHAATPEMDPKMLIQPETIAQVVAMVINLPQGITTGDLVLQSMHLKMD